MSKVKGLGNLEGHSISEIADLLLDRPSVSFPDEIANAFISGKTVLVTGAGGSIGSELCRQLMEFNPKRIVLLDIYENTTYELFRELQARDINSIELNVEIGSIRDPEKLKRVFETFKPQVVFHAAAHKHVPLMEANPEEAVLNNILGTFHVASSALHNKAESFVLISTDKAVNPTSVMGASKRICELLIKEFNQQGDTVFSAVRFGNVLGSHGSVLPLFISQLQRGYNLSVTHREITRYFMSISEAAKLVILAGACSDGGEIFILDMGEPVKVFDMACNLLSLCGFDETGPTVEVVGLRPGEKLFEELYSVDEEYVDTSQEGITVLKGDNAGALSVLDNLDMFNDALRKGPARIKQTLAVFVPSYTPK